MKKNKLKIESLLFPTYISVIKNSLNSSMFRHSYAKINGKETDITKNGNLSCAFYVSSILRIFNLVKELHTTVLGTKKDLENSGWIKVKKPKIGSILIWEKKMSTRNGLHNHIGFYIGNHQALSNNEKLNVPKTHHWIYKKDHSIRKIIAIYWKEDLEKH